MKLIQPIGVCPFPQDNLGHILEEQQDSEGAVRCLKEAIRIKPEDKESHLLLAVSFCTSLLQQIRPPTIGDDIPDFVCATVGGVQYALESLGELEGAEHHYSLSFNLDPTCPTTLYNLGESLE